MEESTRATLTKKGTEYAEKLRVSLEAELQEHFKRGLGDVEGYAVGYLLGAIGGITAVLGEVMTRHAALVAACVSKAPPAIFEEYESICRADGAEPWDLY